MDSLNKPAFESKILYIRKALVRDAVGPASLISETSCAMRDMPQRCEKYLALLVPQKAVFRLRQALPPEWL